MVGTVYILQSVWYIQLEHLQTLLRSRFAGIGSCWPTFSPL